MTTITAHGGTSITYALCEERLSSLCLLNFMGWPQVPVLGTMGHLKKKSLYSLFLATSYKVLQTSSHPFFPKSKKSSKCFTVLTWAFSQVCMHLFSECSLWMENMLSIFVKTTKKKCPCFHILCAKRDCQMTGLWLRRSLRQILPPSRNNWVILENPAVLNLITQLGLCRAH